MDAEAEDGVGGVGEVDANSHAVTGGGKVLTRSKGLLR